MCDFLGKWVFSGKVLGFGSVCSGFAVVEGFLGKMSVRTSTLNSTQSEGSATFLLWVLILDRWIRWVAKIESFWDFLSKVANFLGFSQENVEFWLIWDE